MVQGSESTAKGGGGPEVVLKARIEAVLEVMKTAKRTSARKRLIRHLLRNGVPETLEIPLGFLLFGELHPDDKGIVSQVEKIRADLAAKAGETVPIYYSPRPGSAGTIGNPVRSPQPGEIKYFTIEWISNKTSIDRFWGTFIYLCSNYSEAKNILELGACAGISGCFMTSGKWCKKFITIEASEPLANIARSTIRRITENYQVHECLFDEGLDRVLPSMEDGFDMVWIDGHHEKVATLHYFERLIPYLERNCLVLFDDVYWSVDMHEAWEILNQRKGFSHTIDLGRCGLCVWSGDSRTVPKLWDLSKYTGNWQPGQPHGWQD